MKFVSLIVTLLVLPLAGASAATLAKGGKAKMVIVIDPGATDVERYAARELATNLVQITGAEFEIQTNSDAPSHAIIVGQGTAAAKLFHDVPFYQLNGEEWIIRAQGEQLLLAGGRPRGSLYALSRFLQDQCGVRWWTPWASYIPKQPTLRVSRLNIHAKPAFEYRAPFWFDAFDGDWSWENLCNGQSSRLTAEQGGKIEYAGFVHTFYGLVPPHKYFSEHPEWYSLVKGKRTTENAQLCTTDPNLRGFIVERVRKELHESSEASIVSVSQNDCFNPCECTNCEAIDDKEGSHSGSMLALVNYVAEKIAPEFPNVAVDTLAYQYTRKPPKNIRPATNVIVRLCSIECNFRQPLDTASNASFASDIRNWAAKADRLYIWDYVTDFGNYLTPFPDWYSLGPNIRFFQANHVRGIFEEGAYHSHGAEMAELRAWALAQLMINPKLDDRALIREFLNGYYGSAGKFIEQYMSLVMDASKKFNLTCGSSPKAPYLDFKTLAAAEKLWQQAEESVAGNSDLLARVRMAHLPVRMVWLERWKRLRKDYKASGALWPLDESKHKVAEEWRAVAAGVPGKPWTKITQISEGGQTPATFLAQVDKEGD